MSSPVRGEIWYVQLDPVKGHEQGGTRPCLVVSTNDFNQSRLGLVFVIPITSKKKGFPTHVTLTPPEGGLNDTSYVKCEDLRSIARERLLNCTGSVPTMTMQFIEDRLRILLEL